MRRGCGLGSSVCKVYSIRSLVSVQAEAFYQEWRSPSNSRDWREALQIKRSDSSRGFERVGR